MRKLSVLSAMLGVVIGSPLMAEEQRAERQRRYQEWLAEEQRRQQARDAERAAYKAKIAARREKRAKKGAAR